MLQRAVEDSRKLKRRGTPHVVVFAGMSLPQPFSLPLLMSQQHTNFLLSVQHSLPAQRPGMQPTGRSSSSGRPSLAGGSSPVQAGAKAQGGDCCWRIRRCEQIVAMLHCRHILGIVKLTRCQTHARMPRLRHSHWFLL